MSKRGDWINGIEAEQPDWLIFASMDFSEAIAPIEKSSTETYLDWINSEIIKSFAIPPEMTMEIKTTTESNVRLQREAYRMSVGLAR